VRLALDDKGDARGTFTVLLHGLAAQSLSEAFETVVGTDRREMLRGVVLGWLPWADVEDVTLSSAPGSWEVALRIDLPAGAKVTRAPDGLEIADPHVQARRRVTLGPGTLDEDFTLSLPTGTIGASHYPSFVEKVQAIDDGFMTGTRVRVK
jgi:hypothetical protein